MTTDRNVAMQLGHAAGLAYDKGFENGVEHGVADVLRTLREDGWRIPDTHGRYVEACADWIEERYA